MIIRVDNRVRVPEALLPEAVAEELRAKFERRNPKFWQLRKKGLRTWGEPAELKCWRREGEDITFGRGAFPIVAEILRGAGVRATVRDERAPGLKMPVLTHFVETREYQDEALAEALRKENCIIRASTGAGKTTLGLAIAAAVPTAVLVLVDSSEIANEWIRRCEKELETRPSFVGKGKFSLGRVTVALHQTLAGLGGERLRALLLTFGCVIADEVQICGAKTYNANVDRMPARYRIGLSDDHHRVDGKDFLVTDLFGRVAHKTGDRELLKQGAIAGLDVVMDPTQFRAPWYTERARDEEGRIVESTAVERNQLIDEMSHDDRRSSEIALRVAEEIGKGSRFLVFAHRTEHCRTLVRMLRAAGVPAGLMLGGTDEFESTRAGLLSGLVKAGVGTLTALGKGVNVPDVDAGYAATPIATSTQTWRQATGRLKRPKEDGRSATLFYAWDGDVFGDAPLRKIERWCRKRVRVRVGSELLLPAEYARRVRERETAA